jgi:hypothetical protein
MKTCSPLVLLNRFHNILIAVALAGSASLATPAINQTVTIKPGWNAIYVEVLPSNPALSAVFTSTNIQSIWTYDNNITAPDFVQEVTETSLAKAGWRSWIPTNRVDAFQNDLFALQVNRAYLVKYGGATPLSITLAGRPSLRRPNWQPDNYNLRGFPIDPGFAPTFLDYFRFSPAHYSIDSGMQPIHRLNAAGTWQRVGDSDQMATGEAYWVYCKGNSDYLAPITAFPTLGDGLDFSAFVDEQTLALENHSAVPRNITIADTKAPATNPLSYESVAADGTLNWARFVSPLAMSVSGGATSPQRIAIRRADMSGNLYETVLKVIDGLGTRLLIPVSAERELSTPIAALASGKAKNVAESAPPPPHVGLWVGTVTLNAVSEAHSGTLATNASQGFTIVTETNIVSGEVTVNRVPNSIRRENVSMTTTPTGSEMHLRLMLHVDGSGQTRLLKEVIQMWKNGTTTNDLAGRAVVDRPARVVLVTDDSKLSQFVGVDSKNGVATGRRISAASFDFAENELPMSGTFDVGGTAKGTIVMSASFARNPFKHRFHPDHQQGFEIKRVIELQVVGAGTNAPPGYGDRILEGTYRETVSGLHRTNIVVSGAFQLNRISTTAVLNE